MSKVMMNKNNLIKYILPYLTDKPQDLQSYFDNCKNDFKMISPGTYRRVLFPNNDDYYIRAFNMQVYDDLPRRIYASDIYMSLNLDDFRPKMDEYGRLIKFYFNTHSPLCDSLLNDALIEKPYISIDRFDDLLKGNMEMGRTKKMLYLKKAKKQKLHKSAKFFKFKRLATKLDTNSLVKEKFNNSFKLSINGYKKTFEFKIRLSKSDKDWDALIDSLPAMINLIKSDITRLKYNNERL